MSFQDMEAAPGLAPAIRFGVPRGMQGQAARLYWNAFGGKLGRVLGPQDKALAFIERAMAPGYGIAAEDRDGRIVGIIGFRTQGGAFVAGTADDLHAVYGGYGALWRRRALGVLARDLAPGAIAVDGLAVAADRRGQGIGRALIEGLAAEAGRLGYRSLRLDVVAENLRARALYERLGFTVCERADSRLTALFYGFRTVYAMQRPLRAGPPDA